MKWFFTLNPVCFAFGLFFVALSVPGIVGVQGPNASAWAPALFQTAGSAIACFIGSYLMRDKS